MQSHDHPTRRPLSLMGAVLLASVILGSAALRIEQALTDPGFVHAGEEGALKSDPGLLYYVTQRLTREGGVPADFRADPRVEHPDGFDTPARLTVGQELLIAWIQRLGDFDLLRLCVVVSAFTAAAAGIGVFGATRTLTRSVGWAGVALLLWATLPASYRTIGFVLVRENLSLPLFALHLWWLARAARDGRTRDFVAAGVLLGAAAATWHLTGLLIALEAGCLLVWFLVRDQNALERRRAWIVPALWLLFALAVPALHAKRAFLAAPLQISVALLVAARLRGRPRAVRAAAALVTWAALFTLAALTDAAGDLSHVRAVLLAKLVHLGTLPLDPEALSFEARLMWQGPFATLGPAAALGVLQVPLLLAVPWLVVVLRGWRRGVGDGSEGVLALLTLASLAATFLVARLMALSGILLPVAAVLALRRFSTGLAPRRAAALVVLVLLAQTVAFQRWLDGREIPWYSSRLQSEEIAGMVRALPAVVPASEAVACDPVNSTAILAHTGRPIVLQPKWESAESRRRFGEFLEAFYRGTPEDLRRLLLERYDCRYLLVDRYVLWFQGRYALGALHQGTRAPRPDTAAEALLSQDAGVLASIPGYELVWRSPPTILQSNGNPTDFFRLFRLVEEH